MAILFIDSTINLLITNSKMKKLRLRILDLGHTVDVSLLSGPFKPIVGDTHLIG